MSRRGNLAQSESDRVLRDAIVQLRRSETSLRDGTNRAERHHRAGPPSARQSTSSRPHCESVNAHGGIRPCAARPRILNVSLRR